VIAARGYRTVTDPRDLRALGFDQDQAENVPALLVPYRDAEGTPFYQFRPDRPQQSGPKYVTPRGKPGRYGLDIPEPVRECVLHSDAELRITEGAKKADAAVGAGLCCVSLPGVWMFTRKDEAGRPHPLPDWERIPLQGRAVVVCYDSDAVTKPGVHAAMRRLSNLLRKRGAKVQFCYLPDDGEAKVGLDDFLAAGHSVEELRALVTETLRPIATAPVQALMDALNRRCQGVATFHHRQLDLAGDGGNDAALAALKAMSDERNLLESEFKFWAGDAYNRLDLPHGSKIATLERAVGQGWARQLRKWASVCREFSGDRACYRVAADFWFLAEIEGASHDAQDSLLEEHLNQPFSRDRLRARRAEMEGRPVPQEARGGGGGGIPRPRRRGRPVGPAAHGPAVAHGQ
jgi:hypothetical protein